GLRARRGRGGHAGAVDAGGGRGRARRADRRVERRRQPAAAGPGAGAAAAAAGLDRRQPPSPAGDGARDGGEPAAAGDRQPLRARGHRGRVSAPGERQPLRQDRARYPGHSLTGPSVLAEVEPPVRKPHDSAGGLRLLPRTRREAERAIHACVSWRMGPFLPMAAASATLYLVYLDVDVAAHPEPSPDLVELAPGLYLTESSRTRSQVYHAA